MMNRFLLFLIVICQGYGLRAQDTGISARSLKILDYNVLEGFQGGDPAHVEAFERWVDSVRPDIIGLEEMNGFSQAGLETFARRIGFPYAILLKETGFPVALLSRFPIAEVSKVTDNMTHGFIKARILDYYIVVLHLSPWSTRKKIEEVNTVLANVFEQASSDKKIIIMGDFNSLSAEDSMAHQKQHLVNAERILEKVLDADILINGRLDYTVCNKMKENGFTDSWSLFNHTSVSSCPTLKYTPFYPPRSYRIDYIWVSRSMKDECVKSYIVKDSTTHWLSDHYPVILELKR